MSLFTRLCSTFVLACLFVLVANAHDAVDSEKRAVYEGHLASLQQKYTAATALNQKREIALELGSVIEEIRSIFNQDILSHGATQGLETQLLLSFMAKNNWLVSGATRSALVPPNLSYFEEAAKMAADTRGGSDARFRYMKANFYSRLSGDPLKPKNQATLETKRLINFGREINLSQLTGADVEEFHFISAIHEMQAYKQNLQDRAQTLKQVDLHLQALLRFQKDSMKSITVKTLRDML
jgi:hypothetical protein